MHKVVTKKNVLIISLMGTTLVSSQFFFDSDSCGSSSFCHAIGGILNQENMLVFSIAPLLFFLSLLTYRLPRTVFGHWMGFAIWSTPLLMLLTFLINKGGQNGLGMSGIMGGAFDTLLLGLLYGAYIFISLFRIVKAWRAERRG